MAQRSGGPDFDRRVVLKAGQTLFVPAHPRDAQAEVAFELRAVDQLGHAILGFTTPDRLVTALGDFQPWLGVDAGWLASYAHTAGLPVCLDPKISPDAPRWTSNDLAEFIGGNE